MARLAVHASCVVAGERGILIRGEAGAGKSTLARRLVAAATEAGGFARLVADDRVILVAAGGRVVARPHAAVLGAMEVRGLGVVAVPHEPACVLSLVIDIDVHAPRMPDGAPATATVLGCSLQLVRFQDVGAALDGASWLLRGRYDTVMSEP